MVIHTIDLWRVGGNSSSKTNQTKPIQTGNNLNFVLCEAASNQKKT